LSISANTRLRNNIKKGQEKQGSTKGEIELACTEIRLTALETGKENSIDNLAKVNKKYKKN
jgi:hypothetical protein